MLYRRGAGELWYYDEEGNFVEGTRIKRDVGQGCVVGMILFCLTMEPVYGRLRAAMGESCALYIYCDDSYLMVEPNKIAEVLKRLR